MALFQLIILLFIIHFVADYTPLSTKWMLAAKHHGTPFHPILCHGLVHGALMFCVLISFGIKLGPCFALAALQTISHAITDTVKGKLTKWFPNTVGNLANHWFWITMGADQVVHQIVIIYMALVARGVIT